MAEPFLSEIRIFSFGFAPRGWAMCNGQILPISQNTALFSLLGTTYGGDGRSTFALPNLQARVPMHSGQGPGLTQRTLGESGGEASHTLSVAEIPAHTHPTHASANVASEHALGGNIWAAQGTDTDYSAAKSGLVAMHQTAITGGGGGQPHENRPPFLVLSFCIALQGIFPSRN